MIKTKTKSKESGRIFSFFSGVAKIQGLPHIFLNETLLDETDKPVAIVIGFDENFVEALFFDENFDLDKLVFRSHKSFSISISEGILGRIVGGFGQSKDEFGDIQGKSFTVFRSAPQTIDREPVVDPLSTGIKIIDVNLPLGRGQRELIIGDRKLGKSTIAIDTIINQKNATPPVYCVYVICGKKEQQLKELISIFEKHHSFLYTVIVAATAGDSFAEQYLAPFVGCAIGEYFRDNGKDALIVYDDLSKHAKTYRDISLILERAPGREAYPGDIFSLHAELLERAAKLSKENGGGSLTALPIVETQEDDITSFIPTNIISITDGQIYLGGGLFQKGFLPAVNVGLSVSRIGSSAQPKVLHEVVGGIRLALSQHKELQKLSQLETVVGDEAKKKIDRGDLILGLLKQEKHTNTTLPEQVILFYIAEEGFFDDVDKEKWFNFEVRLMEFMRSRHFDMLQKIAKGEFGDEIKKNIKTTVNDFKYDFFN